VHTKRREADSDNDHCRDDDCRDDYRELDTDSIYQEGENIHAAIYTKQGMSIMLYIINIHHVIG
jgi:hypothetical protein